MRYIVALLFIIFVQSVEAGALKIIFRYDDYSRNSNTDVERLLFDTIKNIGGGVLVGVIPFPHASYPEPGSIPRVADLDEEKVNLLKEYASQGVVEIAVHGYSHKSNATEGSNSEFTGLSKNTQNLLLGNAKAALEAITGFSITSFIPPFNQYDLQTLQSLESTGYKLISAALDGSWESTGNLTYLPGGAYPQKINEIISSALASGHTEAIVVIVMHPYDIIESGDQMSNFRRDPQISIHKLINDLSKIKKRNNVHFMTIHELFKGDEEFSVERLQANINLKDSFITRHRLLPQDFNMYPVAGLYYAQESAKRMYQYQLYTSVFIYGVLFFLVAFITQKTVSYSYGRIKYIVPISYIISLSGGLILLVRSLSSGFYITSAIAFSCFLGILVGTLKKQFKI